MTLLPPVGADATTWVREHLGDLVDGPVTASGRFRGGQIAADAALAAYDVTGYAGRRNQVLPATARGASALSPWIRHGLLPLPRVWAHVAGGPAADVRKFRDELLWQEYARHLYARLGRRTAEPLRYEQVSATEPWPEPLRDGMACLDAVRAELDDDGWLVNQTRMWLAGHWVARAGADWREGEDWLFRRLLDGSRAANRLGWQWTGGTGSGKPYGFSRWQVEKRAPALCRGCALQVDCPIQDWPGYDDPVRVEVPDPLLRSDSDPAATGGPSEPAAKNGEPAAVWLHGESLGTDDPALAAHPGLPAVFVFDEPLLRRLRLAGKRLVFLAETLAGLAAERELVVRRGDVAAGLAPHGPIATTFAPVPGWRAHASRVDPVVVHPWPWLRRPHAGPVTSYSAWVRSIRP